MSLWFVLALMTATAVFAVLLPLARRSETARDGADVAVYRDQLGELERDRRTGLIGAAEAEAARVEVARRLIAASDAMTIGAGSAGSAVWRRRVATMIALTLVPFAAMALYATLGSPSLPGAPLAQRSNTSLETRSLDDLVAQVEAHLAANPEDGRGWEVLAPVYLRLGRIEDAVKARRNALRLLGANATRESDYGEALMFAANGIVTAEAKEAFDRALKHDPTEVKARYLLGLAAEQDGKREEAAAIWRALLADAPADAPWVDLVRRSLARLGMDAIAGPGGPNADEVAAAEGMPAEARAAMVRGMVERLATRLEQDGSDVEGWLRLVRAYMVLGEPDRAKAAAASARRAVAGDADKLRRLDDLMRVLGLET